MRSMGTLNFTAIDFEAANSNRTSACSVGITTVRAGEIIDGVAGGAGAERDQDLALGLVGETPRRE